MATKKQSRKKTSAEPVIQEPTPTPHASEPSVAELAHHLYVERGGAHGHDVDDWLEAERRLRNGNA